MSIRVSVFDKEEHDGEWPPMNALGFINWFQAKLATVPAEYRDKTVIELGSVLSYEDSHYARIEMYYDRPETSVEKAARVGRNKARREEERERLQRQLAALDHQPDTE